MLARGLAGLWLAALAATPSVVRAYDIPIDSGRSHARFSVQLLIMPSAEGRFARAEGRLQAQPGGRWRVQVVLDAGAITFDGPDWLARMTRSEKFLDVEHYPEIRFVSEPFTPDLLQQGGALAGRLSLRGQVRPVVFRLAPSRCDRPGWDCAIDVEGEVSRREFGMQAYRLALRDRVGFAFAVHLAAPLP